MKNLPLQKWIPRRALSAAAGVVCLTFAVAPTAGADPVLSTMGGDTAPYWFTYLPGIYLVPPLPYFAQSFTTGSGPDSFSLNSISFLFDESFSPQYPIEVAIYSNSGGAPGAFVGSLSSLAPEPAGPTEFTSTATNLILSPETSYWITLYSPLPDGDNVYQIGMSYQPEVVFSAGGWTTDFAFRVSADGSSWTIYEEGEGSALLFSIDATAVPEPSAVGLGLVVLGGLGWLRMRRKSA